MIIKKIINYKKKNKVLGHLEAKAILRERKFKKM